MTRPKRLWAGVLVNVVAGLVTLLLAGVFAAKLVPVAGLRVSVSFVVPSAVVSCVLVVSSIFALRGNATSRWLALGTAILFFCLHFVQSLWVYYHPIHPGDPASLAGSVERAALGIALNLWAFLSDKTDEFFDAVSRAGGAAGRETP